MKEKDPWSKAEFALEALGQRLKLRVPHDVFSTQRIDEGTLLLLEHLPAREPKSVLDVGCGYGALGLPVAARFPAAQAHLIDRDLLAVRASESNARAHALENVQAYGSLGYRDVKQASFDWILCNVPARIGTPFIEDLLVQGRVRLEPDGELRVVVIRDLVPTLEEIRARVLPDLEATVHGPRHSVFTLKSAETPVPSTSDTLYLRDHVEVAGITLARPFDLGGDDPMRLRSGLPALLDSLPRSAPSRVLTFRAYYGGLHALLRARYGSTPTLSIERDLLAAEFQRLNAGGLALEVQESADLQSGLREGEKFPFVVGELSPSAGEKVMGAELAAVRGALEKGGQALFLVLEKTARTWALPEARRLGLELQMVLAREAYAVLRLRA